VNYFLKNEDATRPTTLEIPPDSIYETSILEPILVVRTLSVNDHNFVANKREHLFYLLQNVNQMAPDVNKGGSLGMIILIIWITIFQIKF
jgi:hypothetical protein